MRGTTMQQETKQQYEAGQQTETEAITWDKAVPAEAVKAAEPGAVVARHGDLYVKKHEGPVPRGAERVRNGEILRSEVTGHVHGVVGKAKLFAMGEQVLVQVTGEGGLGRHAEHGTIQLPAGTYEVSRKREYQDDGSIRRVVD